jgi:hypothetical protein
MNQSPSREAGAQPTEKQMKDTIKQTLACNFTEEEKVALAQEMAQATVKKADLENALSEISAQYKADIKAQENLIRMAATKIHDGYEYRDVECEVEFNVPERGQKTITRSDTGETFIRPMTMQEKADLFCNCEPKDDERDDDGDEG